MELHHENKKITIKGKVTTLLDGFVLDFVKVLEQYVDYVIVRGYVVILFGRARGTEDIDTIIKYMEEPSFVSLYNTLTEKGYFFLNPEEVNGLYEMLGEGLGIRIAKKGTVIPNIELKFVKDDYDAYSIENRVRIVMDQSHLFVSPIELQIPYKLYLGSEKDIEDAVYLWDIFEETLDMSILKRFMEGLQVRGDLYGIEI
jgi:hypothetical protein